MPGEIINGHNLRAYFSGSAIAKSTECSISLATDMKETSHKDVGTGNGAGFKEVKPGEKSGTVTTSGLYAEGETYDAMATAWLNGTKVPVLWQDGVAGNKGWSADAYISSLEQNAPNNESVTYSVTFELSGEITRITQ